MYRAYLMRDHIGEEFTGRVSGVQSFGVFVELDEPFVEGMIKLEALGGDSFEYDDKHMVIRGRRSGLTVSLGDPVRVELVDVSVARGGRLRWSRPARAAEREDARTRSKTAPAPPDAKKAWALARTGDSSTLAWSDSQSEHPGFGVWCRLWRSPRAFEFFAFNRLCGPQPPQGLG